MPMKSSCRAGKLCPIYVYYVFLFLMTAEAKKHMGFKRKKVSGF